jgi:cystathionine beta-lyase
MVSGAANRMHLRAALRQAGLMTEVVADPLEALRLRTSEKWTSFPPDVLPLFVAEMDYPLAPAVSAAIIDRVRASDTGYVGDAALIGDAFSDFAERRWGWGVDPELVTTATDVSVGIVEVFRRILSPGDGVLITPPVYAPFFEFAPEAGGVVVEVPLLDDGTTYSLDLAGIEAAFASGTRVMLLCNPHNPLGLVHTRTQLVALAELALEYGAIIVADEIHGLLTHSSAEFVPYLSVSDAARATGITVTSASKAFNLAGVKCAVIVAAGAQGAGILRSLPEEVLFRTSLLGLHASVAGFTDSDDYLDATISALEASSSLLASTLASTLPTVGYRPPGASYLAWIDLSPLGWGEDPALRALEVGRVALNSGLSFGTQGAGFARLNFACSPEVLVEAVQRIAAAR